MAPLPSTLSVVQTLRIALVVNPFTLKRRGGGHAAELARELLGRGHTVRGFGAAPGDIPRSAHQPRVDGGVAPDEGMGLLGFQPDVILAYDALSPAAWLAARRARKLGVPWILVEEGLPEVGSPLQRFMRGAGRRLWGSYVRRSVDRVIVSDPAAAERAAQLGFDPKQFEEVVGGIDLVAHRPNLASHLFAEHGIRGRAILRFGGLEEGRGTGVLIDAFARTVGRREDWSLVLVGKGPAQPSFRAQVDRLGVGSRVHWLPQPRREERPGLMGSATLLASPGTDRKVGSLTVRQALACGLPVLASDIPRLRSYVEHDGTGQLVTPGDVDAWTEAIRVAAGSPVRRRRWGERARQVAQERFSWPVIAERIESICREVVAARSQAGEPDARASGAAAPQEG